MFVRVSTVFILVLFCFFINADQGWSTDRTDDSLKVCYSTPSLVYCASGSSKQSKEPDLRNYLSVFLQFGGYEVNEKDMQLHPGIRRLISRTRPEQKERILTGVVDYLLREGKTRNIVISSGKNKSSLNDMTEDERIMAIEYINWPKYLDVKIERVKCVWNEKINLSFSVMNTMKKDFVFRNQDVEMRVMGARNELVTAGSIFTDPPEKVIKAGERETYSIDLPVTGDMVAGMRYIIYPFIKNIRVKSEGTTVVCEKSK